MKSRPLFFSRLLLPAALISFSGSAQALTKANNATSLNAAGSWAEAAAPSSTDVLLFNSTGVPTAGGLTVGVGASATVGGSLQVTDIAGNLSITQSTGATWTLGNGGIDMSAATADVTIGGSGKNLRWANGNYGGISVAAGRTLTLNSNFSNQGNTKTIAMTGSGNIIFNGSAGFGGATSFNVNGANVTLNNASGGWTAGTITAGSLVIGNTNALQNQTVTNNAAAGIKFGTGITSATLGNLAGSGSIELTNADTNAVSLAIGGNNSSQTYSGSLSGAGTLTKNGTGTLTLSGSSSAYTGGVALNSGTLSIGNSNGAGTGASTITALTGTTVFANSGLGGNAIAAAITLSGTSANVILTNANASGGFGSAISGSADQTLTISQAGGANVNLNASTKQLQNFNGTVAIASGQNVAFRATSLNNGSDNALFEVNGNLSTRNSGAVALGALTGSGTLGMGGAGLSGQNLTYTIGARGTDATFSGVIQDGDTGGNKLVNVSKTGAGVQTLSGASTYTG
ncbi:autotransporter-associated beta strand repeat-containing protein, partial [bacterium]|nr:autotransporter-associated beta strand repeat-containing protein [bacterium]